MSTVCYCGHPTCPATEHKPERCATACCDCLRADVERLTKERDELKVALADRCAVLLDWAARAEKAERERDEARNELAAAREELAQVRVQAAELQAALRGLEACAWWSDTMQQWVLTGRERTYPALERARAALAKAEGRP